MQRREGRAEFFVLFDRLNLTQQRRRRRRSLFSPPIPHSKLGSHFSLPSLRTFPLPVQAVLLGLPLRTMFADVVNLKSFHLFLIIVNILFKETYPLFEISHKNFHLTGPLIFSFLSSATASIRG